MQEEQQIQASQPEIPRKINEIDEQRVVGDELGLPDAGGPFPVWFARYELRSLIGKGALGNVYRAWDPELGQEVAVKVIRGKVPLEPLTPDDEQRADTFQNELHAARLMRHPHILRALDSGVAARYPYIVTELVTPARTLRDLIKAGPVHDCAWLARIIYMCARGLAHVHRHGVVHRDIKPENILYDADDNVRIGDFGIACMLREGRESGEEDIPGSPCYISPEQWLQQELSHKSDLFSLGAIFYELLTGQKPFHGNDLKAMIRAILREQPMALSELQPGLPAGLQQVLDKCLAKQPGQRYNSCKELADALCLLFPEIADDKLDPVVEELDKSIRTLDFFADFTDAEVRTLAENVLYEEYQPAEDIIREGHINNSFYILTRGSVEVNKGQVVIDKLGVGKCFGEMGYLANIERTASILALEPDTAVIRINSLLVEQLPANVQLKFTKAFIRVLVARLQQTTSALTAYLDSD